MSRDRLAASRGTQSHSRYQAFPVRLWGSPGLCPTIASISISVIMAASVLSGFDGLHPAGAGSAQPLRTPAHSFTALDSNASLGLDLLSNATGTTGSESLPGNSTENSGAGFDQNATAIPDGWQVVPGEQFLAPEGSNLTEFMSNISQYAPQAPGSYNGHFWSGFQYSGSYAPAYALSVEMQVPTEIPEVGSFAYFGLLSAFDGASNYDQIGIMENWLPTCTGCFSSPTDSWYLVWVSASMCGTLPGFNSTNWGADVYPLIPGNIYNTSMVIFGGPGQTGITFTLRQQGYAPGPSFGYPIWSHYYNYQNPGWFGLSSWGDGLGNCGSGWGYTDYEEEYGSSQQLLPNWNSYFWDNIATTTAGSSPVTTWTPVWHAAPGATVPSRMHYGQSGSDLEVDNNFFSLNFTPPQGVVTGPGTTKLINGHVDNDNATYCTGAPNPCRISALTVLSITPAGQGLTASISPGSGNPYFTFVLTVVVPSTARCQIYQVDTKAYSSSLTAFTTDSILVYVLNCPPTGGGGGAHRGGLTCNIPIWTPGGWEYSCHFGSGSQIYAYNFATASVVSATVHNVTSSSQGVVINFNHGQLKVSAYSQPIYILNSTYQGWKFDPQSISYGDLFWNPQNGTWIPVNSIVYQYATVTVYDIVVNGSNNNFQAGSVSLSSQW